MFALSAVLIPPAAAMISTAVAVDRMAIESERTVLEAARTVQLARALEDTAQAMERHARQREALEDARFAELYRARREEFVATARDLARLPSAAPALAELRRLEAGAHDVLTAADSAPAARAGALSDLSAVTLGSQQVLSQATDDIQAAAERVSDEAQRLQVKMLQLASLVVPLLAVLLVATVYLILRPLRQLDRAIHDLGKGAIDQPIRIDGPGDLEHLGTRLEWLRGRLVALESDRVRLFRHVSHELKTPLTCIREGTQLLADGVPDPPTDAQSEVLSILQSNAGVLQRRIEDILAISAIRRGDTQLDPRPADLAELARQATGRHALQARALGVTLELALAEAPVVVDRQKVSIVLDNLLSNALKFSPRQGHIRVGLSTRGGRHRLRVEDDGPGILPADHERIFEAFYQSQATHPHPPGTGLGLSIAREYARAHGGDVYVSASQRGRGACLIAEFPAKEPV